MKATETLPENIAISVLYCSLAVLTFYILKRAIQATAVSKESHSLDSDLEIGQISSSKAAISINENECLGEVNFCKAFTWSFFTKYSLFGLWFTDDKKYLLKQFLLISAAGACCLTINSIIVWPCFVVFGVLISVFFIYELLVPYAKEGSSSAKIQDSDSRAAQLFSYQGGDSLHFEQSSDIQIPISIQRCSDSSQRSNKQSVQSAEKAQSKFICRSWIQLSVSVSLCFATLMLMVQCILTIAVSVSNSGLLNLGSLGLVMVIDQLALRPCFGVLLFTAMLALDRAGYYRFTQNTLLLQGLCKSQIQKQLSEIFTKKDQESLLNYIRERQKEEQKRMDSNLFEIELQNSKGGLIFENSFSENLGEPVMEGSRNKTEGDFRQFFEYDLQCFEEQWVEIVREKESKKSFKRASNCKSHSKTDSKLYFPYEEHMQSQRAKEKKLKLQQQEQMNQTFELQDLYKSAEGSENNVFYGLSVIDLVDQAYDDQTYEEQANNQGNADVPEIGLVLQEKTFNRPFTAMQQTLTTIDRKSAKKIPKESKVQDKKSMNPHKKSAYLVKQEKDIKRPYNASTKKSQCKQGLASDKENSDYINNTIVTDENSFVRRLNFERN